MLDEETLDSAGEKERQRAEPEEHREKYRELRGLYIPQRNGALHGEHALHDRLMAEQCPEKRHPHDDEQPFFIKESFHGAHDTCFSEGTLRDGAAIL